MSNIYHTEPPTEGKVLIHTTAGDIDIELWAKEAPLACRNFIQLSLEGYYDNTIFHRIIKDFMIQGGDPTGTGQGGTSIWGKPFKDEVHGRIKFNHRGQVAMANENRPNTNQSQFFITLAPCEWLNRKHTIFGKITGNTIFNVLKLGEIEVGANDRPVDIVRITSVEVLWNPFDDITPRATIAKAQVSHASEKKDSKKERKAAKDLKLLSFGDDEPNPDEIADIPKKMISAHDANIGKLSSKVDEELLSKIHSEQPPQNVIEKKSDENDIHSSHDEEEDGEDDFEQRMLRKIREKRKRAETKNKSSSSTILDNWKEDQEDSLDQVGEDELDGASQKVKEYAQLKKEMLRSRRAIKVLTGQQAEDVSDIHFYLLLTITQHRNDIAFNELLSPLEQRRQRYVKRKKEFGNREEETLSRLEKFTSSLKKAKEESGDVNTKTIYSETYTGQVLEKDDEEFVDTRDWHLGKLKFRKHIDDLYRMGGDGRSLDDYRVEDSRMQSR